jgi:hypothetical protein
MRILSNTSYAWDRESKDINTWLEVVSHQDINTQNLVEPSLDYGFNLSASEFYTV